MGLHGDGESHSLLSNNYQAEKQFYLDQAKQLNHNFNIMYLDYFFFFLMSRLTSFQGEPYVDDIYNDYFMPLHLVHIRLGGSSRFHRRMRASGNRGPSDKAPTCSSRCWSDLWPE